MKTGKTRCTSGIGRTLLGALALVVLVVFSLPQMAQAETAAGTTIINTVTVAWTGGSDQATATLTVALKPTAPELAFVTSTPADLTTGVGEGQAITVSYTLTSQANGVDNYTLAVGSTDAGVLAPSGLTINGNTLTVDLGASMALQDVTNNSDIVIPGLAAVHGLGDGDTVIINNVLYTINGVPTDDGINTTIKLNTSVTIDAGTPIQERISFNVTLTTGTGTGTHAVKSDAYVTGDIAIIDTDTQTITVTPASLDVSKTVSDSTPQPAETITYTIDVENTSGSPAANVTITDPIPAFTTFAGNVVNDGCTVSYSENNPGVWISTPTANANVTDIRFECGTLAANDTIQVKFDVTID